MTMLPFALPDITEREVSAAANAVRSGWLTSGKEMLTFEQEISDFLSRPYAKVHTVALNSATAGLLLVLQSLKLKSNDEVIVPSLTFAACAETVIQAGGKLVLADVDDHSLCMSLGNIRSRLTIATKAVILVHFAGAVSPDYDKIVDFCATNKIALIEDAAHAFGAAYRHDRCVGGSSGSYATVYSFYATKCITTGEGGMVCTTNEDLAKWMRIMRLHGISHDVFDRYTSNKPKWEYDVSHVGWKMNMSDVAAAIGRVQFDRFREMQMHRWRLADYYGTYLPSEIRKPWVGPGNCVHLYPIRLPVDVDRNAFIERMFALGIGVSVHFKPLHKMSAYESYKFWEMPVTEDYWNRCVSLPVYSKMTSEDAKRVVNAVKGALSV